MSEVSEEAMNYLGQFLRLFILTITLPFQYFTGQLSPEHSKIVRVRRRRKVDRD